MIAASLTADDWEKQSTGLGTKGERWYDWARIPLWRLQMSEEERGYGHYRLIRRSRDDKQERAYYVVYAHKDQADLKTLAQVAGHCGEIESGFEETKRECGLDHYEVRQWHAGIGILRCHYWPMRSWLFCEYQRKKTPEGWVALSVSELRKLRWIYDKPLYIRPEIGKRPSFLDESNGISLGTTANYKRAISAIKDNKPFASGSIDEYLTTLVSNLEKFRIFNKEKNSKFDDQVIDNIEKFIPYRNEVISLFIGIAQYAPTEKIY